MTEETRERSRVQRRSLDQGLAAAPIPMPSTRGYDGWLVLEQDTAITADEPAVGSGSMLDVKESIAYLHDPAHNTQEVHQ
jgi:hypothetical protein